jgi:hypothetical protein
MISVLETVVFWDITQRISDKACRFEGTYRLHPQGWGVSRERNRKNEALSSDYSNPLTPSKSQHQFLSTLRCFCIPGNENVETGCLHRHNEKVTNRRILNTVYGAIYISMWKATTLGRSINCPQTFWTYEEFSLLDYNTVQSFRGQPTTWRASCILLGYSSEPQDVREMFLRNVGWLSTDYTEL